MLVPSPWLLFYVDSAFCKTITSDKKISFKNKTMSNEDEEIIDVIGNYESCVSVNSQEKCVNFISEEIS